VARVPRGFCRLPSQPSWGKEREERFCDSQVLTLPPNHVRDRVGSSWPGTQ
jgi:hypothetical protein